MTVGFDGSGFIQQQTNLNPKYPAAINPTIARVLTKDPVVARKKRAGLGRDMVAKAHGHPEGFSVLNNFGNVAQSKQQLASELTFLGLCTKQMEKDAINTDTGIYTAVDIQGHTYGVNRSAETIHTGDQIMWDIPEDTAEAKRNNLAAGNPTAGGYPETRYTTFLRPYKPERVAEAAAQDWRQYLMGENYAFSSTPSSIDAIKQHIAIGILIGGVLLPSDLRDDGVRVSPGDFAKIVKAVMSGIVDRDVPLPQNMDERYQELLGNIVLQMRNGNLDRYIATMLTPSINDRVISGKRVPRGTGEGERYINDVQKNGVGKALSSMDQVFSEAGRDRVIGRALESASPGSDFGLIMYGK